MHNLDTFQPAVSDVSPAFGRFAGSDDSEWSANTERAPGVRPDGALVQNLARIWISVRLRPWMHSRRTGMRQRRPRATAVGPSSARLRLAMRP